MFVKLRISDDAPPWKRYAVGGAIFLFSLFLRFALMPIDAGFTYVTFYPAVMLSLLISGTGPGVMVILASAIGGYYIFVPPYWTFDPNAYGEWGLAFFLCSTSLVAYIIRNLHRYAAQLRDANDALNASERRLQQITDDLPLTVAYFDPEERIQFANRQFRKLAGQAGSPVGEAAKAYMGSPLYEETYEQRQRALKGERIVFTLPVTVRGEAQTREVSYLPDVDANGVVRGIYGIGYDITEREELSAALQEAQADLESILNGLPARITCWRKDNTNRFINRAAARQFRIRREEALGKHASSVIGEDRYNEMLPFIAAALEGYPQSKLQLDPQPDGSLKYSNVEFVPERRNGEVVGLYVLGSDVTELHNSMERIRELARRLDSVREEERKAIAHLLHEGIAQDLFAMKLGIDQLKLEARNRAGVTEVCNELASAVDKCMTDARQVAQDLLPSELAHMRVAVALENHARYFSKLSRLAVTVTEAANFPTLDESTRLMFFRIAQEALTNVARHAQASRVDIALRTDDHWIVLDVTDDGIGIDVHSRSKSGSLGLLGIHERIAAAGGELSVRKNGASGTTLNVRIPFVVHSIAQAS